MEIEIKKGCSQLVHVFKRPMLGQFLYNPFEQMNNLRTVTRLGVDKFTSRGLQVKVCVGACELANTLRLKEEEYYAPFFNRGGDILTLVDPGDILTLV
jgi:hypothetical protein